MTSGEGVQQQNRNIYGSVMMIDEAPGAHASERRLYIIVGICVLIVAETSMRHRYTHSSCTGDACRLGAEGGVWYICACSLFFLCELGSEAATEALPGPSLRISRICFITTTCALHVNLTLLWYCCCAVSGVTGSGLFLSCGVALTAIETIIIRSILSSSQ